MKLFWPIYLSLVIGQISLADETKFSTHLQAKFHVKGCTNCHDFFVKKRSKVMQEVHKDVTPSMCTGCHDQSVTGFKNEEEWFSRPGLYVSGMNAKQTCQAIRKAINADFKNDVLIAKELEKHFFDDPRVLWAIAGATPNSGKLPEGKKELDLVPGGMAEWKAQVTAWIKGGALCK